MNAARVLLAALVLVLAGCGGAPQDVAGTRSPTADTPVPDAMGRLGPLPSATPGAACLTSGERGGVVRFRSGNGALIAGVVLGTGRVGVVFAHSNNTNLCDWIPYARVLAGQGYRALSIDLNGYGASQTSPGVPVDPRYDEDLVAAVDLLRRTGTASVFLIGEVIGGTAAVKAAAAITPPVAGVIDVSSPSQTLNMDGVEAARRLRVPLLCIASDIDEFLDGTRAIAQAATGAPEHELLVVAASAGETMLFDPSLEPAAVQVRARVAAFLTRHSAR